MKIYLHISVDDLEYLNKVLKYYANINSRNIRFSFDKFQNSVMVSLSPDDYQYLTDHNALEKIEE